MNYILTNISYTGDMIWQKTFATDTIPFRQVRNRGQKPQYFAENCHPPIVSRDEFQRVQSLMAARKEQFTGGAKPRTSVYSKRIYCGECGSMCRMKITHGKTYWVCHRHDRAKENCPAPQVPEREIQQAVLRCFQKLKQNHGKILRPVLEQLKELRERELRSNRKISDIDREIAHLTEQNLVLVRLKSKGYVDPALYLSQTDEIGRKLRDLRKLRRRAMDAAGEDQQIQATEQMLDYLTDSPEQLEEVDEELFESLIDRLTIQSAEQLNIQLRNGLILTEPMERTVR